MHKSSLIIHTNQLTLDQLPKLISLEQQFEWLDSNPDLLQIKSTDNTIGIAETQKLVGWAGKRPYNHSVKVAIVWQAEKLTPEAQNSLLKTLEEPASNTLIILVTNNISSLLSTILSRCQLINFRVEAADRVEDQQLEDEVVAFINADYLQKLTLVGAIEDRAQALIFVLKFMQQLIVERNKFLPQQVNQYLETAKACYIGLKSGTNIKLTLQLLAISMEEND